MTAKAQRRGKKRKRHRRADDLLSVDPAESTGFLSQLARQAATFDRYLSEDQDLSSAIAAALDDLRDAARRVADLAERFDAYGVLEYVRYSQAPPDPETYRESEHEGSAAVIEFVALVLAARGQRSGTRERDESSEGTLSSAIRGIVEAARSGVDAGSMVVALRSGAEQDDAAALVQGALLREVFVRNLSYPHMVDDTLAGLFDDRVTEAACRSAIGVSVTEIRSVFNAAIEAQSAAFADRTAKMLEVMQLVSAERAKQTQQGSSSQDHPDGDPLGDESEADPRARVRTLLEESVGPRSYASVLRYDDLATRAGVSRQVVVDVVDLFATDMRVREPAEAVEDLFEGRSPFRTRPLLRADDRTTVIVDPVLLTPAIRERVEAGLKGTAGWDRYIKHRGDYLETESLRLLQGVLPGADVRSSFEYYVPDPSVSVPQQEPSTYTKLVEGDGLVLIDDVAIVVEAKAGALTPRARTGDANHLGSDLRKIVTDAARQADRMRERIVEDHGLRLKDQSWLDLDHVREVHTIAVSLEDLTGIATITTHLVGAGLLPFRQLPWTVSLHDLRIICELTARPAELLLYLRRRTEPSVTSRFHAVDELDFFLEYYASGLYVEPDPEDVAAELPQLGDPSVAAKRRFKAQQLTFLASRTDALDAYYFHMLGLRSQPAPRPSNNADPDLLQLVDALAVGTSPGWLSMGATLLDAAGPVQRSWGRHGRDLVEMTRNDGRRHSMSAAGGRRAEDSFLLIWISQGANESRRQAELAMEGYTTAKKHQLQLARGFGMLFNESGSVAPVATTFDNRVPGPDRDLDAATAGLRSPERSGRTVPPRAIRMRRGRA